VLLAALATVALVVVIAVLLLSGGDGGDGNQQQAESTPQRTETPTPSPTEEPKDDATPEPTAEKTATPEATDTPAPSGEVDLDKARQLQVEGYNARLAGDYGKSLELSQQAIDACGNSNELDPCGYALFEKGLALNRSGKPDEAIPVLEERLDRFGDNEKGEVAKELKAAKKAAG
jgi:tetratricopeptide (TPR) repeat protein